jgi:hypothetical protein
VGLNWTQLARDLADRLDTDLPARVPDTLAIDLPGFQAELQKKGLLFCDPTGGQRPDESALDRTAEHLIRSASRAAAVSGAVSGMAGIAGVPPEVAWHLVQLLRLAQRLIVVYGHDPDQDKGRLLVQRAIAAGLEIELPAQAGLGLRVRDLPAVLRDSTPTAHQGATWLAQAAIRQSAKAAIRPFSRSIPGLASAPAAWLARRSMRAQAQRMHAVIRRGSVGPRWAGGNTTDAIELP